VVNSTLRERFAHDLAFVYREELTNLRTAVYLTETVFDGQYEC